MDIDFSKIFHQSSKDRAKGHPPIPLDDREWPEDWKTIYYKTYPRLPKINLEDGPPAANLFDVIKTRQSRREYTRALITKLELSLVLKYSCGNIRRLPNGDSRRAYAAGGARYPIEVYPIIFRAGSSSVDGLKAGLYHYNVKHHQLDVLWEREFSDADIDGLFTYPWVKDAAIGIVMTAVFRRTQNKYGERGYRYILLETGHIGQNIYLVSEALGLKCCALGGTKDENLEKLIDIDGVTESVVYAFAVGK